MIERKEDTSLDRTPPLDDSLVYIPLEDVPDGLLDKLPDFKVIVKDKQGDRILPKERLEEVLKSMGRGDSLLPGKTHSENSPQKTAADDAHRQQSPRHSMDIQASLSDVPQQHSLPSPRCISRTLNNDHPPSSPSRLETYRNPMTGRANLHEVSSHSASTEQAVSQEEVSQLSNSDDFDRFSQRGLRSVRSVTRDPRYSEKDCGYTTLNAGVTMDTDLEHEDLRSFLETTPQKCSSHSALQFHKVQGTDDRTHSIYTPYQSEIQPSKQKTQYRQPQTADVKNARKQLFTEHYLDLNRDDRLHTALRTCCCDCPDETDHHVPRRGLKRKFLECEKEAPFQLTGTSGGSYTRPMVFGGIAEKLLQDLHPSKRHHHRHEDVGPSQKEYTSPNCPCALMKAHFLRMTERAYLNIRRHDSTSGSFDLFRKELTETNSVLQESVRMLRSIQQICTHNNYQGR